MSNKPNVADLLNNPVPVKKAELYDRLRDILALGWQEMPANVARYNGTGGPGNFLEDLIGLKAGKPPNLWEARNRIAELEAENALLAGYAGLYKLLLSGVGKPEPWPEEMR